MSGQWLYLFLLLWSCTKASIGEEKVLDTQKKKTEILHPSMAPNSKFLNPHLDEATNLQFAVAAFADDSNSPEDNKSKASEILSKLVDGWSLSVSSREPKSLDDWRIISLLNALISGNKNYKFKKDRGTDGCLPRRTKELTDSYVPVGIQALYYYKSHLQSFLPYEFTPFCGTGKDAIASQFPLQTDVCVSESLARINLLLIDLQREAVKQNLENSQGLSSSVLTELEKTSQMSAAQQFHFILKKLQKEKIRNKRAECKITEFIQDLENQNSKLYRNFLNIKPLNYLE